MKLNIFLTVIGIAAGVSLLEAKITAPDTLNADLDTVIYRAIADRKIVGAVVVVSKDGQVIYHKAAGFADREDRVPMMEHTSFRLASMTKAIVSVAALRLAEQGRINLDDPVTKYLPHFRPRTADGKRPMITLRHLLSHTAGLSYGSQEGKQGPYHKLGVSDGLDDSSISLDENVRRIGLATLSFKPGSKWQYSMAIDVLGNVLEKAVGKSLPEVVRETVTGPLKMNFTEFWALDKDLAVPYVDGDPPKRMSTHQEMLFGAGYVRFAPQRAFNKKAFPSGGAGMVGTIDDYRKFLEAVRTGNIIKDNDLCLKNQIGPLTSSHEGWGYSYCGAALNNPRQGDTPQTVGSVQWGGVYGSTWWIDPEEKLSVVIMTNTTLEGMIGNFPLKIRDVIYRDLADIQ